MDKIRYLDRAKKSVNNELSVVEEIIKHSPFNKTFRAKIIDQVSTDKYKVQYKNVEYIVFYDGEAKIGDTVWVCVPQNNWDKLYIQSQSDKSDDNTVTQVNGVKGSAETSYKSGYVNISPEDIGLGKVPNVATNDQTPTFTQAPTLANISSGEKLTSILGKLSKWIEDYIQHKNNVNHITESERADWNDANSKKHIHSNKSILDGITQTLIDRVNGGTADMLSNAVQIADYNTFVPAKVAAGAITPIKANTDANSPWNNTTSGLLVQSNSANSWHLLIFRSGGDGWAYRSYYQNVWNNWKIWSTFDGKYSSLTEKPTSFPPSTHSHTKSQITDMPTSMPASDVPDWAKATAKPSYTWDEVNGKPTSFSPSTHTHAISNITSLQSILDSKVPYRVIGSADDSSLNDLRTTGIYYAGGGNLVKDKPSGVDAFGLFVYNTAAGYITQDLIVGNINPGKRYTRIYATSIWSEWIVLPVFTSMPEVGKVLISNDALGGIKTSPYTVAASVPLDAKFTDTVYTHPNSGATAGTYKSVTVNAQGHVTGGTNPTTLAGYGITDAASASHTHTKSQITDMPTKLSAFANDVGYLTNSGTPETFVMGTQTATTGVWTGILNLPTIYHGLTIIYWLPYTGSGNATLNLTLSDGSSTGAINCYFRGTTALTTHYPAGSAISLTYLEKISVSGNGTYTGWWASADYDSNDYYRLRYQQGIKCGTTAIVAGNIIVGNDDGYQHLKLGGAFDIRYPILYANTAMSAGSTGSDNYVFFPFTIATTQSLTLTAYRPVYIKGNLSGTVFTPISTTPLTQNVPTLDDGYQYLLLGTTYSTTAMYLLIDHPIYEYKDGVFQEYSKSKGDAIITAPSSGWSSTAPYSQTISVNGVKSTDAPSLFPYTPKTFSPAQIKLARRMFSYVTDAETGNGTITLFCGENKPSSDFDILAIGVSK